MRNTMCVKPDSVKDLKKVATLGVVPKQESVRRDCTYHAHKIGRPYEYKLITKTNLKKETI